MRCCWEGGERCCCAPPRLQAADVFFLVHAGCSSRQQNNKNASSAPSCIVHSLLARTARSPPRFDGRCFTDGQTASNKTHLMQPYVGEPCVEAEQRGGILDVLVVVAVVAVDVMRNLRSGVAGRQTANVVIMKSPKGTTPSELSGSERSGKGHARTASMRGVLLFLQRQHNTPGGGISI